MSKFFKESDIDSHFKLVSDRKDVPYGSELRMIGIPKRLIGKKATEAIFEIAGQPGMKCTLEISDVEPFTPPSAGDRKACDMTIRESFAASAMSGLLANHSMDPAMSMKNVGDAAKLAADSLLKSLSSSPSKK